MPDCTVSLIIVKMTIINNIIVLHAAFLPDCTPPPPPLCSLNESGPVGGVYKPYPPIIHLKKVNAFMQIFYESTVTLCLGAHRFLPEMPSFSFILVFIQPYDQKHPCTKREWQSLEVTAGGFLRKAPAIYRRSTPGRLPRVNMFCFVF